MIEEGQAIIVVEEEENKVSKLQDHQQEQVQQIVVEQQYSAFDYEQNQAQLDSIQKQIEEEDKAIISEVLDLEILEKEYANNQGFLQKIQVNRQIDKQLNYQFIKAQYPHFRRVRRDGSCFYRAFLFKIFEQIVLYGDQQLQQQLELIISKANDDLAKVGYDKQIVEEFQTLFKQKLDLTKSEYFTPEQLLSIFSDKETADTLNLFLRWLTSGYIKANAALFENFADFDLYGGVDMFCSFEVDPIDKDADQLQIIALMNYLKISIKIIYLDANINTKQPTIFTQPDGVKDTHVTLLYRPGHYDILYGF